MSSYFVPLIAFGRNSVSLHTLPLCTWHVHIQKRSSEVGIESYMLDFCISTISQLPANALSCFEWVN